MLKQKMGKNQKSLHLTVAPAIAIDQAWSNKSGGSPWCSRKSRTVWQNCAKIFAGKQKKTQFWPELFRYSEQDRLLFARVDIGVTDFPTKTAEKE